MTYQEELDKATKQVEELKKVLDQLNAQQQQIMNALIRADERAKVFTELLKEEKADVP